MLKNRKSKQKTRSNPSKRQIDWLWYILIVLINLAFCLCWVTDIGKCINCGQVTCSGLECSVYKGIFIGVAVMISGLSLGYLLVILKKKQEEIKNN